MVNAKEETDELLSVLAGKRKGKATVDDQIAESIQGLSPGEAKGLLALFVGRKRVELGDEFYSSYYAQMLRRKWQRP